MKKKWKCQVCGYIHEGDSPPENCPVCNAESHKFFELNQSDEKKDSIEKNMIDGQFRRRKTLGAVLTGVLVSDKHVAAGENHFFIGQVYKTGQFNNGRRVNNRGRAAYGLRVGLQHPGLLAEDEQDGPPYVTDVDGFVGGI